MSNNPKKLGSSARGLGEQRALSARALVVDDNRGLLDVVEGFLQRNGISARCMDNPVAALKLVLSGEESFDFIILDITMPEVSGTAFHRQVRERHPSLPILLYTGFSHEGLESYLDDYTRFLQKPFKSKELIDAVTELLNR